LKPSAVVNNGAESDIAVQAYIEALLFDGGTNVENPVASSAAEASQNLNQEPSLASSSAEGLDATAEHAVGSNPVGSLPDAANSEHALSDPLAHPIAQGGPLKATLETSTESKSTAFLKQLEAAQRGGAGANRSALLAGAQRVDTRPLWGREDFSCLSFKVAGLKLAVPVEFVDGMQPLDLLPPVVTLHSDAGDPNTSADIDEGRSQNMMLGRSKINRPEQDAEVVNVIDTARLVMPERYDPSMTESYRYILSLKNCDWSIAVDSIGGELALSPQNVRWRSEHTRREWLAGTVVDKMCALVDIDVLDRQIMADSILIESD
jgi:hypothetical protein